MYHEKDDERKINLLEILWEFLIQWRMVVLVSLVVAVVVSGAMYLKERKLYRAQLKDYKNSVNRDINEDVENAKARLTSAEISSVESTVFASKMIQRYAEKMEQISNIKLSDDKIQYEVLEYKISTKDVPLTGLLYAYNIRIVGDDILRKRLMDEYEMYKDFDGVIDMLGHGYNDMIQAPVNNDNTMQVSVVLAEGVEADRVAEIVREYIDELKADIEKTIPHELQLISTSTRTYVNMLIQDRLKGYGDYMQTYSTNVSKNVETFTDQQKEFYRLLLIKEGITQKDTVTKPAPPKKIQIKRLLLWFVIGMLTYLIVLALIRIVGGRVQTLDETAEYYGMRGLDEIHDRSFDKLWHRFVYSRFVYGFHYRKHLGDIDTRADDILNYVAGVVEHKGLSRVSFIQAFPAGKTEGIADSYAIALQKHSDSLPVKLQVSEHWVDGYMYDPPVDKEGIVIVMQKDKTKFRTLERIAAYSRDFDLNVIGVVLLEG